MQREDKERIQDSKQQHRKEIDENRLSRKQARAASRSSATTLDAVSDRQLSHAQASTSSPAKAPIQRLAIGARQTRGSGKTKGRPAKKAAATAAAAAAASITPLLLADGKQARLGRAKSRANRSGRASAWGMHTEAEPTELTVKGRRANPTNAEAGVGTALGGLVKVRSKHSA